MISLGLLLLGLNFLLHYKNSSSSMSASSKEDQLFGKFQIDFNKAYQSADEFSMRKKIFFENLDMMRSHNSKNYTYKVGINQFSDMTFTELYDLNYASDDTYSQMDKSKLITPNFEYVDDLLADVDNVPESFDWRDVGGVNAKVKDQKLCGSCYAFAVLEEIESQLLIKTHKSYEFSRQEIIDCARDGHGALGCDGGILYGVHSYIHSLGGLSEEKNYSYAARESECRNDVPKINLTLSGIRQFDTGDEEALKKALFTFGPVVVIIDNLHDSFFRYSSGIYYEPECNHSDIYSHAVVIVGYGSENGEDYWTIKNSYSEKWGEKGMLRIARNRDNHCNIASFNLITKL